MTQGQKTIYESFSFEKGINLKKSPLLLENGEMYSCQGFDYDYEGAMTCRSTKTQIYAPKHPYDDADLTGIHKIHRYNDRVLLVAKELCPGDQSYFNYLFSRSVYEESGVSGIQNYADYTPVDVAADRMSVEGTKITITTVDTDESVYLYKDFGANSINESFTHKLKFECTAATAFGQAYVWGISNHVEDLETTADRDDGSGIGLYHIYDGTTYSLHFADTHFYDVGTGPFYITIIMDKSASAYGTVTIKVYSDENRTIEIDRDEDTSDDDLTFDWPSDIDYRYVYAFSSNSIGSGGREWSGVIEDLDLTFIDYTRHEPPMLGNTRPSVADYKKFTFIVDEEENKAFVESYVYPWGIENPSGAPVVSDSGIAGNPDGTYYCYVTFYITFSTGEVYETGPSSAGSVTVETNKIQWNQIPICEQTGIGGAGGLTIHRKLYRTISGTTYHVHTIEDNTTKSYTDNEGDTDVQANAAITTTGYNIPPTGCADVELHIQRMFLIKGRYLYYSEPYIPQAFKATSYLTVSKHGEDLIACIQWGDQLYLATKERWLRLSGTDSTTWAIKNTFTETGIVNKDTLVKCSIGLIGLYYDGIYVFDGIQTKNVTEKILGTKFFRDLDDLSVCHAEYAETKYHFYYASSGSTIDSHMVIDFGHYPDVRVINNDFIATAHEYNADVGENLLAKADAEYAELEQSEAIVTSLRWGDRSHTNIIKQKDYEYLYYDIDTGGIDVIVTIYTNGTSAHTITLNTSTRERKRSDKFPICSGYRASIGISCSDSSSLVIYAPWVLQATLFGD
uniref:Uncharacterized protein n=1 Tax=viral metagenome TaxID=1070528 RepID=A0A6M3KUB8_9ZZZZ